MIDNFAHIGGFLMGILTSIVFLPGARMVSDSSYKSRIIQVAITLTVVLTLFLVGFILLWQDLPANWCPACLAIDCVPIADFKCTP